MGKFTDSYTKILDSYHKERNTAVFYKTQGFKKLWRLVQDLVQKESFQKSILKLRKEYHIPANGFEITENPSTHPPSEWEYSNPFGVKMKELGSIRKKLINLFVDYSLLPQDWVSVFEQYLFYNKLYLPVSPNSHDLCFVSDSLTKKDSTGKDISKAEISTYPVTLHISPDASKRDILDYVKKIFKTEIEPMQNTYKKKNSSAINSRKRNPVIQQRKEFIYQNQDWSLKDIQKGLEKETGEIIDIGLVGKIKSLENKKRA